MNVQEATKRLEGILETLAEEEHRRWAHWQAYMHKNCELQADGSLLIPAKLVSRWEKQIRTSYSELSEAEKESDREQVRRYLPIVARAIGGQTNN